MAKIGAGTPDIAANNLVNFLQKISSPDTARDFEKAGIDFDKSKATLVARGMSPIEATLRIIDDYMKRQEPQTRKLFAAAINAKTPDDQKAAAEAIGRSSALGVLFQDIQAMGFIRSALPNMGMYKDIRQKAMNPGDVIDKDFANRIDQATFAWQDFKNAMWAASVTLGQAVLPALTAHRPVHCPDHSGRNFTGRNVPACHRSDCHRCPGTFSAPSLLLRPLATPPSG